MDNLRCLSVQVPGDYSYVIKRTEAAEFEIRFIELSKDHLGNCHRDPYKIGRARVGKECW